MNNLFGISQTHITNHFVNTPPLSYPPSAPFYQPCPVNIENQPKDLSRRNKSKIRHHHRYSQEVINENLFEIRQRGMSVKNISDKNNIPPSTIYSWLHKTDINFQPRAKKRVILTQNHNIEELLEATLASNLLLIRMISRFNQPPVDADMTSQQDIPADKIFDPLQHTSNADQYYLANHMRSGDTQGNEQSATVIADKAQPYPAP